MITLNSIYSDAHAASAFVAGCEMDFDSVLNSIAADILSDGTLRCLTLAGPTCSGKTTAAARLTACLEAGGRRARVISIDDFYREKAELDKSGITDLEGPDAIDRELFTDVVGRLSCGRRAMLPVFDFTTRTRAAMTEYIPTPGDIYIFEGIQAIYPQITSVLRPFGYRSIFISVADDVSVKGTVFCKNEIRLMRRTVRDYFHRATGVGSTMERWQSVRANEEANIFPYTGSEDYRINSMLPYEIFLIGKYYKRLAGAYPEIACMGKTVRSIVERLALIEGSALDISMIPINSVFREFIA